MNLQFLILVGGFFRCVIWLIGAHYLYYRRFPIASTGMLLSAINSGVFAFINAGYSLPDNVSVIPAMTTVLGAGLVVYGLVRRLGA